MNRPASSSRNPVAAASITRRSVSLNERLEHALGEVRVGARSSFSWSSLTTAPAVSKRLALLAVGRDAGTRQVSPAPVQRYNRDFIVNVRQKTISREASVAGPGLFSGETATLTFAPRSRAAGSRSSASRTARSRPSPRRVAERPQAPAAHVPAQRDAVRRDRRALHGRAGGLGIDNAVVKRRRRRPSAKCPAATAAASRSSTRIQRRRRRRAGRRRSSR